jgi:2-oxoglutarate dehydrogenase E2 component (dihydrolipoamide succinyltransferase)
MGDSITEGSVLEYKKQVGEYVKLDEIIAIVETDKV